MFFQDEFLAIIDWSLYLYWLELDMTVTYTYIYIYIFLFQCYGGGSNIQFNIRSGFKVISQAT